MKQTWIKCCQITLKSFFDHARFAFYGFNWFFFFASLWALSFTLFHSCLLHQTFTNSLCCCVYIFMTKIISCISHKTNTGIRSSEPRCSRKATNIKFFWIEKQDYSKIILRIIWFLQNKNIIRNKHPTNTHSVCMRVCV